LLGGNQGCRLDDDLRWEKIGDDQVWDEDLRLARQAPGLSFDALWSAEHHFFDYSFCPDNLQRRAVIGDFELNVSFRFGGIPYEKAQASLQLFAREVLPVLKSWHSPAAKAAE
jgi:hypothetical protein